MKLNFRQLKKRCLMPFEDFAQEGVLNQAPDGWAHIFIDRGAKVLGVAHLDSVGGATHFVPCRLEKQLMIFSEQLDDRLGAYLLLDYLPALGLDFDVLLTEGEETGHSTAEDFKPAKEYNWVFSFDRAGMDVVMYQYEDSNMRELLKEHGFRLSMGTFSDISSLDHLGVKCFNFGTGYYDNHTQLSRMVVKDTREMADAFVQFFIDNQDIRYPHTESVDWLTWNYKRGYTDDWMYDYAVAEREKGIPNRAADTFFCSECGEYVEETEYWHNEGMCYECKRELQILCALRRQKGEDY